MNFALIKNEKVVLIVGMQPTNVSQWDACVPCNLNVQVSDDYIMGIFYRNGVEVLSAEQEAYINLEEEYINNAADLMDDIEELCNELIGE